MALRRTTLHGAAGLCKACQAARGTAMGRNGESCSRRFLERIRRRGQPLMPPLVATDAAYGLWTERMPLGGPQTARTGRMTPTEGPGHTSALFRKPRALEASYGDRAIHVPVRGSAEVEHLPSTYIDQSPFTRFLHVEFRECFGRQSLAAGGPASTVSGTPSRRFILRRQAGSRTGAAPDERPVEESTCSATDFDAHGHSGGGLAHEEIAPTILS